MGFLSQKCDILFLLVESAFGRSLKYIFIIMNSLNEPKGSRELPILLSLSVCRHHP